MKKKSIETVAYCKKPKCPETYQYTVTAKTEDIKGEETLLVDIYDNNSKAAEPWQRRAYTKKDWAVFYPAGGTWSTEKIGNAYEIRDSYEVNATRNSKAFCQKKTEKLIARFTGANKSHRQNWREILGGHEHHITWERESRVLKRKQDALNERCRNMPEIPESFNKWIEEKLFEKEVYLFYKRKGRYATFFCSECGKTYTYPVKKKESFEGAFEHVATMPYHNTLSRCEKCDAIGTHKAAGKCKEEFSLIEDCYIGQSLGEGRAVIRYFQAHKTFKLNGKSKIEPNEVVRVFYEPGKKRVQIDYNKYSGYTGKCFWDYCNLSGNRNIPIRAGKVFEETWENLKGTCLEYSGAKEYFKDYDEILLKDYMSAYFYMPQIEFISKMGITKATDSLIRGERWNYDIDVTAKTPEGFFMISKRKVKKLIKEKGDFQTLKILQMEKRLGVELTEEEEDDFAELHIEISELERILTVMTARKLINRIEKYAEITIEDAMKCTGAWARIEHVKTTYIDYLAMRIDRGYDMTNEVILFPRDLNREHAKMVDETEKHKVDERLKEVAMKYPEIKKHYRSLRKKYFFGDENLEIRPARSAEEIVMEGRLLHHCVGGDGYLSKHNTGKSIILMLRPVKMDKVPYITVEIEGTKILQWYGAHNNKPEEKNIDKWLKDYVKRLVEEEKKEEAAVV